MSWTFNSTIKGRYSLEACLRKFPFVCPSRVQPFARAHADRLTYVLCHLADRRTVFVSSETKWQLAEAARLLEEQMRLLEVEREESLFIGRQCAARSKRLMARMDNLRDYRTKASQRRSDSASSFGRGRGATFRSQQAPDAMQWSQQRTSPPPGMKANSVGRHPSQQQQQQQKQLDSMDHRNSGSLLTLEGPGLPGDSEEAQTRRLVSHALRRNMTRGENNLALAEKLQQYLDLLKNELARVRRGDVTLAEKVLDGHRARTTVKSVGPPAPQVAASALRPAPRDTTSPKQHEQQQQQSHQEELASPPGSTIRNFEPPVLNTAAGEQRQQWRPAGTAASTTSLPPMEGTAPQTAVSREATATAGPELGLDAAASTSSKSAGHSDRPVIDLETRSVAASGVGRPQLEESVLGAHPHPETRINNGSVNNDSSGNSSGYPDAASGLGRIFSRSRLLELPGDIPMVAEGKSVSEGQEHALSLVDCTELGDLERKSSWRGANPIHSERGPESKSSDICKTDAAIQPSKGSFSRSNTDGSSTTGSSSGGSRDISSSSGGGSDNSSGGGNSNSDITSSSKGYSDGATPRSDRSPGPGLHSILPTSSRSPHNQGMDNPAIDPDSSSTMDSVAADSSENTAASGPPASELGFSIEAARSLARDSEDAREALMGLLSPAGSLPGPLQRTAGTAARSAKRIGPGGDDCNNGGGDGKGRESAEGKGGHGSRVEGADSSFGAARLRTLGATAAAAARVGSKISAEGRYALAGEQVPSRKVQIQSQSAAAAAARAATATAAVAEGSASRRSATGCVDADSPSAREVRTLIATLVLMVSELRRQGYVGCDAQVDLAMAQLERALAAVRIEVATLAPKDASAGVSSRRGR